MTDYHKISYDRYATEGYPIESLQLIHSEIEPRLKNGFVRQE
jgi:hypothetical protein